MGGKILFLFLFIAMLLTSCEEAPLFSSDYMSDEGPIYSSENISEEAKVGCRAPDEPGCRTCMSKKIGNCTKLSSQDFRWFEEGEPWYNIHARADCNESIPPCAQCIERDEEHFLGMLNSNGLRGCDCDKIFSSLDPCMYPNSCGCLCLRYEGLSKTCPVKK